MNLKMKNNQNLVSMKNILIAVVMVLAMGMILPATAQTTEKEAHVNPVFLQED